jgi:hypothetical protein
MLTVGPASMAEDERVISKGYRQGLGALLSIVPFGVAAYADLKWVVAASAAVLISQNHEAGGRLYDLCIRLRRTNTMLYRIAPEPPAEY